MPIFREAEEAPLGQLGLLRKTAQRHLSLIFCLTHSLRVLDGKAMIFYPNDAVIAIILEYIIVK